MILSRFLSEKSLKTVALHFKKLKDITANNVFNAGGYPLFAIKAGPNKTGSNTGIHQGLVISTYAIIFSL